MLRLELIREENIELAIKIENEIFSEYNAKNNYIKSLKEKSKTKYYLAYDKDECIGITGLLI